MKQILLENAHEAWHNAERFATYLEQGYATLGIKKSFVSLLHNAVELFYKQIMLNNNDHRVATFRAPDAQGEPLKSYYAAINLNDYFLNLPSDKRRKFFSIEFKDFLRKECNPLYLYVDNKNYFISETKLLNNLRNNATHFYIAHDDFLNEKEFQTLYNFMIDLYPFLCKAYLFPTMEGMLNGIWNQNMYFNVGPPFQNRLIDFSYKKALLNNDLTKWLREIFKDFKVYHFLEAPEALLTAVISLDRDKFSRDESLMLLYSCIKMLFEHNLLRIRYFSESDKGDVQELKKTQEFEEAYSKEYLLFATFSIKQS